MDAVARGLRWLAANQSSDGELAAHRTEAAAGDGAWTRDHCVFAATHVIDSLDRVGGALAAAIAGAARDFLRRELVGPGLWRFWTRASARAIDPDLDDTACASAVLSRDNRNAGLRNHDSIAARRDDAGRFHTWLRWRGPNDVDSVVNANVVMYLGAGAATAGAIAWLIALVADDREADSHGYYADSLSLYYALGRGFAAGVRALDPVRAPIERKLRAARCGDGGFGDPLRTAQAIAAARALDLALDLDPARAALHAAQHSDGSWPAIRVWCGPELPSPRTIWWGSAPVTTALALEALADPYARNQRNPS